MYLYIYIKYNIFIYICMYVCMYIYIYYIYSISQEAMFLKYVGLLAILVYCSHQHQAKHQKFECKAKVDLRSRGLFGDQRRSINRLADDVHGHSRRHPARRPRWTSSRQRHRSRPGDRLQVAVRLVQPSDQYVRLLRRGSP